MTTTLTHLDVPDAPAGPHQPETGAHSRPRWSIPALVALLVGTAVLYLWHLGDSGWANSFYAAAAQAGSQSWKAWFFGSSDAANSITVDKTPAALWITGLSVRLFGLSSWSILVPQALEGVATVALLYATVKRWFGPAAGLLAGATLALTPVAALMFRFNNPDALLMLVLVAGAYGIVRALEGGRSTRWLLFAGTMVGLGFLTKMLQALLVVPVFALVYLICAPTGIWRRVWQLLLAGAAMIVSAGWWVAIVQLTPAKDRPYIGGSQHNSILELTLGYNGFGRLTGNETGSVGGGGAGGQGGNWGATGWTRLFTADMGGQIAWLMPAALLLMLAAIALIGRAPRTDRARAGLLLWGGWLVVTGLVFSFMQGIFHAYYTVALAPAVGALIGMGAVVLWRRRGTVLVSGVISATVAVTAVWSYVLLGRSADFHPWLRTLVLIVGLFTAAAIMAVATLPGRWGARLGGVVAALALFTGLAGPTAYALNTVATPHEGSIVSAGPAVQGAGFGGPGGRGGFAGRAGGAGGFPGVNRGQAAPGGLGAPPNGTTGATGTTGTGAAPGGGSNRGAGGMGGLLNGSTPSAALVTMLKSGAGDYTWAAAAVGSNNASGYQLASQEPVMAIGGFNGSDPSPTLAQFKQYVAEKKIHYFIGGGGFGGRSMGGSGAGSDIASWVAANFTATTVGGSTVYDLSAGA
jgi:4-amino-4-deoxy-L-arabinose transferase-like glycosyltransferase